MTLQNRYVLLSALVLALVLPAVPARAGAEQTMIYEVYAGGIHAVQAQLVIDTTKKGRYDIVLSARTRGLLGSLVPWEGTFESRGWTGKDGLYIPELHKSVTASGDGNETKVYNYTRTGGFKNLVETKDGKPPKEKETDKELTAGTTDVLSATLDILQDVATGAPCNGTADIFDGDRRFEQIFADQGTAELDNSRYNIFRGPASECTVEIKPKGGKWHKKPRGWLSIQEQGRAKGTMPTVWLAQLDKDGPAVPVRIRVKTNYGTLFMHLAEYRSGDKIVSAEKRAED